MMKASDKKPPLSPCDYYRASDERFSEATRLFLGEEKESEIHYWIIINFLSVVAVECLLTAFLLKDNEDAKLVTNHDIYRLCKDTKLIDIEHVDKAQGVIMSYWRYWRQDLRYLSVDSFISRVKYEGIVDIV